MPFHLPAFLLLCIVTLALYWWLPVRYQRSVLLVSSLTFYYYAGITDTVLLLFCVIVNHVLSIPIASQTTKRRAWMLAAVAFNLSALALFKYQSFCAANINFVFNTDLPTRKTTLPLGISFYLFQLISYQVDLYRGQVEREPRFWRLLLYVLFFPHHQAGPIMRPAVFLPQFREDKAFNGAVMRTAGLWIVTGLFKKMAADAIAVRVDNLFDLASTGTLPSAQSLLAAVGFGFQVYGDFSGYSDIAVGLGLLFGYRLDTNFNAPYVASSPSEFWRRWHITLSSWLRDYLYIGALGGNRASSVRTQINLMLTMLIGGLWHGASWMFVLWGGLHGAFLIVQRVVPGLFRGTRGVVITFGLVTAAWIFFRATSPAQAQNIFLGIAGRGTITSSPLQWAKLVALSGGLVLLYFSEGRIRARRESAASLWLRIPVPLRGAILALAVAVLLVFTSQETTFIYFRF